MTIPKTDHLGLPLRPNMCSCKNKTKQNKKQTKKTQMYFHSFSQYIKKLQTQKYLLKLENLHSKHPRFKATTRDSKMHLKLNTLM